MIHCVLLCKCQVLQCGIPGFLSDLKSQPEGFDLSLRSFLSLLNWQKAKLNDLESRGSCRETERPESNWRQNLVHTHPSCSLDVWKSGWLQRMRLHARCLEVFFCFFKKSLVTLTFAEAGYLENRDRSHCPPAAERIPNGFCIIPLKLSLKNLTLISHSTLSNWEIQPRRSDILNIVFKAVERWWSKRLDRSETLLRHHCLHIHTHT